MGPYRAAYRSSAGKLAGAAEVQSEQSECNCYQRGADEEGAGTEVADEVSGREDLAGLWTDRGWAKYHAPE